MAKESAPSRATKGQRTSIKTSSTPAAPEFKAQLAAVERAEERLHGHLRALDRERRAIPDERLEVVPTAERTVEEEGAG